MVDFSDSSFEDEFNLTIQKKFLSILIFEPEWAKLNGKDIIRPEFFENHMLHNLCKWIHNYYKKYKTTPTKLVLTEKARELQNDKYLSPKEYFNYQNTIEEIFEISGSDDFEFFKQRATTFARMMAWKQALAGATNLLKEENTDAILAKFKDVLKIGGEIDLGIDFQDQTVDDFLKDLAVMYDRTNMISTGVPAWDDALGGGFVRNNIHFIAAPSGGGKSRIMAFLAKNAVMNMKNVIFISMELDKTETMANFRTAVTGITMHDMLKPEYREEFIKKTAAFKNTFGNSMVIKFFNPGTVNADTVHNYIRKVIQTKSEKFGIEWKPDVIFIDYMDKMLPIQKIKGSTYEDMGAIANDLKNLAINFECPVITGSQLGKYTWNLKGNDIISMDAISESAQKAHLAHSMTTVNSNAGEKAQNKARFFLAKSRSGKPGTIVWVENNLARCNVKEIEPWDPKALDDGIGYIVRSSSPSK